MKARIIKNRTGSILGIVISTLLSTSASHALPLLVNGGFETGDFTGWTQVSNSGGSGCSADWYVSSTDTQCQQRPNAVLNSAVEGDFSAYNSFDGFEGINYTIEQDIAIGSVGPATLDFSYTVGWDFGLGEMPTLDRVFSLSFFDAGDSLIGDAFVLGIGPSDANTGFVDWTSLSLDVSGMLSGYDNQIITLVADVFIPENKTGPGSFGIDDIELDVVSVPSPSVFYLLGLGLLMMVGVGRREK